MKLPKGPSPVVLAFFTWEPAGLRLLLGLEEQCTMLFPEN